MFINNNFLFVGEKTAPSGQYMIATTPTGFNKVSRDFGETWASAGRSGMAPYSPGISRDGKYMLLPDKLASLALYKSSNGGASFDYWLINYYTQAAGISGNGQYQIVGGYQNTTVGARSVNSGASFSYNVSPSVSMYEYRSNFSGQYWVAYGQSGAYVSTDYGANWTKIGTLTPSWSNCPIAISESGQYIAIADTGQDLQLSTNYGASFSNAGCYPSIRSVAMSRSGQYMIARRYFSSTLGIPNCIYRSTDYGANWTLLSNTNTEEYNGALHVQMSADGKYVLLAQNADPLMLSTDYGATYTAQSSPGAKNWGQPSISEDGKYMAAGNTLGEIWISKDYGSTWAKKLDTTDSYHSIRLNV